MFLRIMREMIDYVGLDVIEDEKYDDRVDLEVASCVIGVFAFLKLFDCVLSEQLLCFGGVAWAFSGYDIDEVVSVICYADLFFVAVTLVRAAINIACIVNAETTKLRIVICLLLLVFERSFIDECRGGFFRWVG